MSNKRWPTAEERTMGKDMVDPNEIEPITEKLDDKIAKLNSSRVYKKITPRYDLSWYVKWVASGLILIAVSFRSAGGVPFHLFDLYFSFVGTLGWLWVGFIWHDRALILLNGALATLLFSGIINTWIE